jgi:hypothetical protein
MTGNFTSPNLSSEALTKQGYGWSQLLLAASIRAPFILLPKAGRQSRTPSSQARAVLAKYEPGQALIDRRVT